MTIQTTSSVPEKTSAERNELRYPAVAETTGTIVMITNAAGEVLEPQAEWIALTGQSVAAAQGLGWIAALHPDDAAIIAWKLQAACKAGVPFRIDFRLRRRDGQFRFFSTDGRPLHRPNDTLDEWVLVHSDLTERREADEHTAAALRELNDLKAAIDEHAIVAVTDAKGRITYVNDKFCAISHYSRQELLGQDHRLINSGFHPQQFIRAIWQTISAGRVWKGEIKNKARDGTFYWVDTTIVPYLGVDGKPVQYIAIRADITDRKIADEQTKKALAELNDVKAAIDEHAIVAITDAKGKITYVNDKFCAISKYAREELLGKDHRVINSQHHPKEFIRNLWQTIGHGRVWKGEIKNRAKDGSFYWVETTIVPYLGQDGKPLQYIAIRSDITERKLAEEALQNAQTELQKHAGTLEKRSTSLRETIGELEAFSYSVSHDMRAPLRAMQSFSKLLGRDCGDRVGPKGMEYIRRINNGAARMDALIQDVLTYSRVARTELPLQSVDVGQLLREVVETYPTLQAPAAKIEIIGVFPPVLSIPAVLTQCVSNLLGNAVKFVEGGMVPHVTVWAEPRGSKVRVLFKDNGLGIEKDEQETIFGIFQRVSKDYDGTGIGLSIVRKGMERMGGSVGLASDLGQGSTFWIEMAYAENVIEEAKLS